MENLNEFLGQSIEIVFWIIILIIAAYKIHKGLIPQDQSPKWNDIKNDIVKQNKSNLAKKDKSKNL